MTSYPLKKYRLSPLLGITLFTHLIFLSSTVNASENLLGFELPKSVQIHGFLSQGFIHTSDNNFFGHSDDNISTDFRELGLNASWRVIPDLQLSLQVVWRDAGQTDEDDLRIDYGIIDYSFYSSETTLLGIKAGRIPTPFGLYNETRDVASTRPSILLPQSIYFDRNRNLALSADGGYLYAEHLSDYGDINFTAGIFEPRTNDPSFKNLINNGEMKGNTSWIARLGYEKNQGEVRFAITYADYRTNYDPDKNNINLLAGSLQFSALIFSAQYNAEKWSLTSEYAIRRSQLNDFGKLLPNSDTTGESFYIQGIYSLTPSLQGILRYDQLIWDTEDRHGKKFATTSSAPNHSRFAKDWTAGLRITVIPSLLISAEYHHVNGTGWLPSIENSTSTQYWNLYIFMVSYNF